MGLSIKNDEVEARVRRLAERTGLGVTEAIDVAVSEKLERDDAVRAARVRQVREEWDAFVAANGPFPAIDQKAADEDLFDEHGLPR